MLFRSKEPRIYNRLIRRVQIRTDAGLRYANALFDTGANIFMLDTKTANKLLVFASGRGGAKISRPAPHRMRGRGMKFRPRPAPEHPGPRTGNGAGNNPPGPGRCTATGPRSFFQGPAFIPGPRPSSGAPSGAPLLRCTATWPR